MEAFRHRGPVDVREVTMAARSRATRLFESYRQDGAVKTLRLGWEGVQHLLVVDTYRKHGFREAARIGRDGVRYAGSSRKILVVLSEPKPIPRAIEAASTHTFKFASAQELEELRRTPAYQISAEDVQRVADDIARCLLQLDGDKLAGYAWIWNSRIAYLEDVDSNGVHVDGVHINLPDDTIYNFKAYTNPDYRGYGFQAVRHRQLLKLTEDEGVRRLFGYVDHFNSNSIKGLTKSGYVPVGELRVRHKNGRATMVMDVEESFWTSTLRT
jgi:GNAT superfamily N-acetyltransferase